MCAVSILEISWGSSNMGFSSNLFNHVDTIPSQGYGKITENNIKEYAQIIKKLWRNTS
jgi:hypothetical protein